MLTNNQIARLLANWGERADALDCNAEVRIYDPNGPWECYIYALEPNEQDQIACILSGESVEITAWSMAQMQLTFNANGEPPENDMSFVPIKITRLLEKLKGRYESR